MSVDLDDPWAEDLALEESRTRHRALSAPQSPPFTNDTLGYLDGRLADSALNNPSKASPIASPKPSTVRGRANKAPLGAPRSASHPLALDRLEQLSIASDTDMSDVSRPALRRMTSITDRQVAESQTQSRAESRCGSEIGSSERGSVDLARAEVEVIVHQVQPNESLPGIALRYGIDLPVLRKVNKLWTSDPVHLRTHLYVPLDACKCTPNGDQIVRGPGGGQVTIVPHKRHHGESNTNGRGGHRRTPSELSGSGTIRDERPATPDTIVGTDEGVILNIVRLPASQLRFFPRSKRETPRSRASLDSDIGKSADSVRSLSAAERAARHEARAVERERAASLGRKSGAMFAPLGALTAAAEAAVAPKKRVVRLRPPQASAPKDDSFAGTLRNLFSVPPPPVHVPPRVVRMQRTESASEPSPQPEVVAELEMDARPWGGRPPRTLRKTDKKLD